MKTPLRIALVGGPMYDTLYERLPTDVEIVVHADHPTLNARVDEMLRRGERIDVLSTHGKYVPSQARWLRPLQDLIEPDLLSVLEPGALDLCRVRGDLLCVPRNIDVRILWWRTDRLPRAPASWSEIVADRISFGFTGRDSGLFGLFFELVEGAGGRLFDPDGSPALDPTIARIAVDTIGDLADRVPGGRSIPTAWRYDEVDHALATGNVDAAAAWPGSTTLLRRSGAGAHLRPAPYPTGHERRVSYSGCHGWAIPTTCGDLTGAVSLIRALSSPDAQRVEAGSGAIPARTDIRRERQARDAVEAALLDVCDAAIADQMITYPPLTGFPELEDRAAGILTEMLLGRTNGSEAADVIGRALTQTSDDSV